MHSPDRTSTSTKRRSAGLSLVEIMFAIMILGIGMAMIAAMFPVAIQQVSNNRDDTMAAEVAKSALQTIHDRLHAADPARAPYTGGLITLAENQSLFADPTYGLRSAAIYDADPRYAWTALYRRGGTPTEPDPYVQVFIFVLSSGDGRPFDLSTDAMAATPNLWPRRVEVMVAGTRDHVLIRDDTGAGASPPARGAVAPGCFVVMQDGTVLRASSLVASGAISDEWALYPGEDASAYPSATKAWIIGRRLLPSATYRGPAQDIALYTTYVKAN